MNACILAHLDFLKRLSSNLQILSTASRSEIACLVEILYNSHRIPFNRAQRNAVIKFLPIIRYIGRCRETEKAREFLITFSKQFLHTFIRAAISIVKK